MNTPKLRITFRSLGRSRRVWVATFQMGSTEANIDKAVRVAFNHNAEIIDEANA